MKKIVLAISFLSVLITGFSQDKKYHSVLDNTSFVQFSVSLKIRGGIDRDTDEPMEIGTFKGYDSVCFDSKVMLKDTVYYRYITKKVWQYLNEDYWYPHCNIYLRETEDKSKLFVRNYNYILGDEALIYDISLNVGDTFKTRHCALYNNGESVQVYTRDTNIVVDSVYYIENRKIVSFNYFQKLGKYSTKYRFIEGIGPNFGLFSYMVPGNNDPWTVLISSYNHNHQTFDFTMGSAIIDTVPRYYSIFEQNSCVHHCFSGEIEGKNSKDAMKLSLTEEIDSLQFEKNQEKKDTIFGKLTSVRNTPTYLLQIGNGEKVFLCNESGEKFSDHPIYTMDLQIGDSYKLSGYFKNEFDTWHWCDTTLTVDTVYFKEGRKIIRFNYWQPMGIYSHYYEFIEGIGPSFGWLPVEKENGMALFRLTNSYQNKESFWKFDKFVNLTDKTKANYYIEFYPNPVQEILYLEELDRSKNYEFAIYNLMGKHIQTKSILNNTIRLNDIASGVYVGMITSNGAVIQSIKIIKN